MQRQAGQLERNGRCSFVFGVSGFRLDTSLSSRRVRSEYLTVKQAGGREQFQNERKRERCAFPHFPHLHTRLSRLRHCL
jgi:hypothetical protein